MRGEERDTPCSIRPVRGLEGERLKEIAIAAKSHWGYDLEQVIRWAATGDFSAEGLREKEVYVAEAHDRVVGWASLIPKGDVCWLDDLWIEPEWMRRRIGSRLFGYAAARRKQLGAKRMEWEAEPHALGFYERMGGRCIRTTIGSWGRALSVMSVDLT